MENQKRKWFLKMNFKLLYLQHELRELVHLVWGWEVIEDTSYLMNITNKILLPLKFESTQKDSATTSCKNTETARRKIGHFYLKSLPVTHLRDMTVPPLPLPVIRGEGG